MAPFTTTSCKPKHPKQEPKQRQIWTPHWAKRLRGFWYMQFGFYTRIWPRHKLCYFPEGSSNTVQIPKQELYLMIEKKILCSPDSCRHQRSLYLLRLLRQIILCVSSIILYILSNRNVQRLGRIVFFLEFSQTLLRYLKSALKRRCQPAKWCLPIC